MVVLLTAGGVAGVAACCRALVVRWVHADADIARHEGGADSESQSDFGSASTFVSVEEDSEEETRLVHYGGVPLTCASFIFGNRCAGISCVKTPEPNLVPE